MSLPAYGRQRKGGGRQDTAFVRINGIRHYLGVYDSPDSREMCNALLAEYLKPCGPQKATPADGPATVNRLLVAFLRHAQSYYVDTGGSPSREYGDYRTVAKILREHSGRDPVDAVGPKRLKEIRQVMIDRG